MRGTVAIVTPSAAPGHPLWALAMWPMFTGSSIHDEFAEWMMTPQYAEAVSDVVGRLGVKARAP